MSTPTRIPTEARYAALDAKHSAALSQMSEKDKALAGLPYNALGDKELVDAHKAARRLCKTFNDTDIPDDDDEGPMGAKRREIIAKLLGVELDKLAEGVVIEPPFWW